MEHNAHGAKIIAKKKKKIQPRRKSFFPWLYSTSPFPLKISLPQRAGEEVFGQNLYCKLGFYYNVFCPSIRASPQYLGHDEPWNFLLNPDDKSKNKALTSCKDARHLAGPGDHPALQLTSGLQGLVSLQKTDALGGRLYGTVPHWCPFSPQAPTPISRAAQLGDGNPTCPVLHS